MNKKPQHLGLIPDGNRRWARKQEMSTLEGHQKGFNNFIDFCKWCRQKEVKSLTAYAFSTENWKRSEQEVKNLMKLFKKGFERAIEKKDQFKNTQVRIVGNREQLPDSLNEIIDRVEDLTKNNEKLKLNLAINYGGRWDIKQAISKIVKRNPGSEQVGQLLKQNLQVKTEPDLIIRTGKEKRLSNFLTWQSAYSELYFSDKLWPDFSKQDLNRALQDYANRERRQGK